MAHTIGIDLGGTRLKAAVVHPDGSLSGQIMEPISTRSDYSRLLDQLDRMIGVLAKDSSFEVERVGLAVAGLMDCERATIVQSPNIPALNGQRLPEDLGKGGGQPVTMDNDANMMALGEGKRGAARESRYYIALTLGTGIGGAVVSDGVLIRGIDGGGGELGHIPIKANGRRCGCGAKGCLEAYVGHYGIENFVSERFPRHAGRGMKALNELALQGDQDAAVVFRYVGETLGIAVTGLVNVFNPEIIVIGGGVSAAGDLVIQPLWEELRKRAFPAYLEHLKVKPAELGNWAGVVGAGCFCE